MTFKISTTETMLWNAVIHQALTDAMVDDGVSLVSHQARTWFESNGTDFREVCDLAGKDPDYVRESALRLIRHGPRKDRIGDARRRYARTRAVEEETPPEQPAIPEIAAVADRLRKKGDEARSRIWLQIMAEAERLRAHNGDAMGMSMGSAMGSRGDGMDGAR